jgi:hypothetical protein
MSTETYRHLKLYERPSDYVGATWYGYYTVAGRNRDSDILTNSNWDCWVKWLTELLGPENQIIGTEPEPVDRSVFGTEKDDDIYNWTICRESHWACGWIELIRVHSSVNPEKLRAIDEKLERLDGYPVFDEQHFSDAEQEEYDRCWRQFGADKDYVRAIRRSFTQLRTEGEEYPEEDAILDALDDVPVDRLIELHESLIPSGEYHDNGWPNIEMSVCDMTWDHLENLIKPESK